MKKLILKKIYHAFDTWASGFKTVCSRGCSACCTQNVTITAVEGEHILDFVKENNRQKWLVEKLETDLPDYHPLMTTNEFASACLNKENAEPGIGFYEEICPFLESDCCSIYEARPFSCRSFSSETTCHPGINAEIPKYYMAATTAVSQIIEHLGQKEYWGNMLHILYTLTRQNSLFDMDNLPKNPARQTFAQTSCLTAKPLPGFLIAEDDYPYVIELLEQIFDTDIGGGKTIEDFLNNK